ncbi:MAG: hypothetical protein QXM31_00905 [Candidatus Woesearchaeota archaeon]
MSDFIDVGDRLVGTGGGWENLVVEVIFVASDGKSGDIRLENGEDVGVSFVNFRKITLN